jgi:hypothetical protein
MMRVRSSPDPTAPAEPAADRAPASPTGPPFRAVLHTVGEPDKPRATGDTGHAAPKLATHARAPDVAAAELAELALPDAATQATLMSAARRAPEGFAHDGSSGLAHGADTARGSAAPATAGVAADSPDATSIAAQGSIAAALGMAQGSITATTTSLAQPPVAGAPDVDSPVTAWLAAAVGRAVGSLGRSLGGSPAAHTPTTTGSVTAASAAAAAASAAAADAPAALTPLEQAVHELIGRLADHDPARPRTGKLPAASPASPATGLVPLQALASPHATVATAPGRDVAAREPAHAAAPIAPPEPPANPSHVHLVLDDGPDRVVVTVAVRGSDVRVALRASDDATTAALARNAASLDHAMRSRGLALGKLTAEHEPRDHQMHDHQQPRDPRPRERQEPDAEPFELEDEPC